MPANGRSATIAAWMLFAIALVTGLAWWDEQREAQAALLDLESEQSLLAWSAAGTLRAHLTSIGRDAEGRFLDVGLRAADLIDRDQRLARPGERLILLAPPNETALHSVEGSVVSSPPLRDALERGLETVRLSREDAARIGLPARTSMAGFAHVDAGDLGRWGVVVVASAARERDREKRAMWRLVLGVLVASGLVLAFGGIALRRQRQQLYAERGLAVSEAQHARDEDLLRAERMATMGTFAMGIAHEVATPLGVIVGRAEQLIGRARDDARATRAAQAILAQADRIQHIIRRFLDMARGGPPSLERVDPSTVVRAAAAAVEHRFARAGVTLDAEVPPSMPPIQCDRDLLEHAIVNLLLNACDACPEGGQVELAAHADAQQVAFVVTDDGAGISHENARRATEPFFTTKSPGGGTGMGLAIATEIVKSHRGELTIGPRPEGGTRALIEIPIAPRGDHVECH
jgi:two-component system NtrC family sensor kinase